MNTPSVRPALAVLGAGPKALALAAKWAVLHQNPRFHDRLPHLIILEKDRVGANWRDGCGYTDGRQQLATPPWKDIGFPYYSNVWGTPTENREIQRDMTRYSWQSYLVAGGRSEWQCYWDWIDRGSRYPRHETWASYLQWIADDVRASCPAWDLIAAEPDEPAFVLCENTAVCEIAAADKHWRLTCNQGDHATIFSRGLVVTGHGTPSSLPGEPVQPFDEPHAYPHISNGANFWRRDHLAEFENPTGPLKILIVGAGGIAADIAAYIEDALEPKQLTYEICMINRSGVIFSRGEGFGENRPYSDPDFNWQGLPNNQRQQIVERTAAGVLVSESLRRLDRAKTISVRSREVLRITPRPKDEGVEVEVRDTDFKIITDDQGRRVEAPPTASNICEVWTHLVVAIGLNQLWFWSMLSDDVREPLERIGGKDGRHIDRAIDHCLQVEQFEPNLYLPMLAGFEQGPGFPTMRSLGMLSDRILSHSVWRNA